MIRKIDMGAGIKLLAKGRIVQAAELHHDKSDIFFLRKGKV
jgi:hypothetical protein